MTLNINEIMDILPHRYPFLLIDRVLEATENRAVGIKNITINEAFFQGHFPGHPIMPGVLIIEAMAQLSGIVLLNTPSTKGKIAYFAAISDARFKRPVTPGDQIRFEVEIKKIKGPIAKTSGKAFVDGNLVAETEMTFSLVSSLLETLIDPTAKIHPNAVLGKDVKIGPHAYIGEGVILKNNVTIEANVVVEQWTTIGENTHVHYGAIIGNSTQDKKFNKTDKSYVTIGKNCDIREYVTINRATIQNGATKIGDNCLLLTMVHIGHDCVLGNDIVMSNAVQVAGHVQIENRAIIGGMAGITQFCRIGTMAMVGGYSKVNQDVPPYMLVEGNPACIRSMNIIGLERNDVSKQNQRDMKEAYKALFRSNMNTSQAIEKIKNELKINSTEVNHLISFLQAESKSGIMKRGNKDSSETES
ncbi:MAG: acyl-ACP--UDP-N-acetylglucosamine O-acyltransferase [Candidatus Margulisbacteria bacterium]|nr:acyl-ACP--UDP-N-acetylglucosamine O-acyltransferase [Candidatus Margulisiibacteriota bacterium]